MRLVSSPAKPRPMPPATGGETAPRSRLATAEQTPSRVPPPARKPALADSQPVTTPPPPVQAPAAAERTTAPPAPAAERRASLNALLVIGDDGKVRDIIWNQLPPLTAEQLHRIERTIRARAYPSAVLDYTIQETLDVRID